MLEIQSSSRGEQKIFIFIQKKFYIYFVLKKYRQVSAIFTDTDTSRYHKNRPIPPIPILKYRYITNCNCTFNHCFYFDCPQNKMLNIKIRMPTPHKMYCFSTIIFLMLEAHVFTWQVELLLHN